MNPRSTRNELDWLAYCYVAGELQGDDAATFEQRLAEDQPAREAVARAVALSLAMAAVPFVESSQRQAAPSPRKQKKISAVLWGGLGLIACVATLIIAVAHQPTDISQSGELAQRWSETLTVPQVEEDWLEDEEHLGSSHDEFADQSPDELLPQAPEWMLAAVSGLKHGNDMSNEMDLMEESQEQ